MNEEKAREILGGHVGPENALVSDWDYLDWTPGQSIATLDGSFSADKLEAIAWWMRNKAAK